MSMPSVRNRDINTTISGLELTTPYYQSEPRRPVAIVLSSQELKIKHTPICYNPYEVTQDRTPVKENDMLRHANSARRHRNVR